MKIKQRNVKEISLPNDPDGAWVKIKALSLNDVKRIDSIANDVKLESDDDGMKTSVKFNPYARTKMIASECLVDWFGFFDEMDNEIPYSKKNIDKIASVEVEVNGEYIDFLTWIDNERVKFENELREKKEKQEKN